VRRWLSSIACLLAVAGCVAAQPVAVASVASGVPSASSAGEPNASPSPPAAAAGACWQQGQWSDHSSPAVSRSSSECIAGSREVERDVGARLTREVRDGNARLSAHVDDPCITLRETPAHMRAVIVEGHGGQARVVGLRSTGAGSFRARVLRVVTGGGPNQAPPGPVEFFRTELSEAAVAGAFDRMRTALAARITVEQSSPVKGDRIELGPVGMSSNNLSLELTLEDTRGASAARAWQGYRGTLDAENRLPIEFAWRALNELGLEKISLRAPQPDDRTLLREAWLADPAGFERPWYSTRALLLLAAVAGSPELIPRLVELLASDDEEIQRLSVDALAAISGHDVRRDATGAPRALGELVAEYRRECGAP
jgi:hypothetical protein